MPISIYDLKRGLTTLDVPVGEALVHVTYRPGVVTPGFSQQFWFAPAEWVARVVESWDVELDDGQALPLREGEGPSRELLDLPTDFLLLVQREINRDLLPGKRWRATSAAG